MAKSPKLSTTERFKKAQAKRSVHSGEPIQDIGPRKTDFVKMLSNTKTHGTVIRRLQQN